MDCLVTMWNFFVLVYVNFRLTLFGMKILPNEYIKYFVSYTLHIIRKFTELKKCFLPVQQQMVSNVLELSDRKNQKNFYYLLSTFLTQTYLCNGLLLWKMKPSQEYILGNNQYVFLKTFLYHLFWNSKLLSMFGYYKMCIF